MLLHKRYPTSGQASCFAEDSGFSFRLRSSSRSGRSFVQLRINKDSLANELQQPYSHDLFQLARRSYLVSAKAHEGTSIVLATENGRVTVGSQGYRRVGHLVQRLNKGLLDSRCLVKPSSSSSWHCMVRFMGCCSIFWYFNNATRESSSASLFFGRICHLTRSGRNGYGCGCGAQKSTLPKVTIGLILFIPYKYYLFFGQFPNFYAPRPLSQRHDEWWWRW